MNFFTFVFLGVVMLSGNTFAVPLSEERRGDECQVHLKTTSPGDDVPEGWKAVNGFQKCYFYQMSKGHVKYQDANQFCQQPGVVGSRLFTPGSIDEMKKVAAAMIPESVTGDARNYWTGFVEFDWQLWKEGPLLFAANAYPFEPMPEGMWNAGQPNDNLPYMEPCTTSAGDGIQDASCTNDWFDGQTIICEAAWNVETPASKRGDANLMHNAQERGQANLMHNARERGQANLMHNARERGQADERRQ